MIDLEVKPCFSSHIPFLFAYLLFWQYNGASSQRTEAAQRFCRSLHRLETAPIIKKCPINMECRLIQTVDFPRHDVFVGEIVETYCDEQYLTEDVVDFSKVQPILFIMNDRSYWKLGERFADAWSIGKDFKESKMVGKVNELLPQERQKTDQRY